MSDFYIVSFQYYSGACCSMAVAASSPHIAGQKVQKHLWELSHIRVEVLCAVKVWEDVII